MVFDLHEETTQQHEFLTNTDVSTSSGPNDKTLQNSTSDFTESAYRTSPIPDSESHLRSVAEGFDPNILSSPEGDVSSGLWNDTAIWQPVTNTLNSFPSLSEAQPDDSYPLRHSGESNEYTEHTYESPFYGFSELPGFFESAYQTAENEPENELPSWSFDLPQIPPNYLSGFSVAGSSTDSKSLNLESSRDLQSTATENDNLPSSQFECKSCSKSFTRRADLNRHSRHHSRPEKCPTLGCSFAAARRRDVQRHVLVRHSGSEPRSFFCPVPGCKYSRRDLGSQSGFTRKDHLSRHMRLHRHG